MTEVTVTDWANYEGDLPEQYPHRQPRKSGRGTEPIAGPDLKAYRQEKRRRLKAMSPTLTVTKVESSWPPTLNTITFDNGMKAPHTKSKNAKVGDKFVVASQDGRFAHILDAEEGNAPIQDPMELGEMANWTPLDGTPSLKRRKDAEHEYVMCNGCKNQWDLREIGMEDGSCPQCGAQTPIYLDAETFEADFDYYYSSSDKARGMEILDRLRTMNPETKSKALDWLIDNGYLHSEEVYDSAYINAMGDALYITSEEDDYDAEAIKVESVSVVEPYRSELDIRMIYVSTREAAEEEAEKFIRHNFPEDIKFAYSINATDDPNRWEMEYEQVPHRFSIQPQPDSGTWTPSPHQPQFGQSSGSIGHLPSPSATIPVKGSEPSWVKPLATALGFTLGFLGIHEIKKVL